MVRHGARREANGAAEVSVLGPTMIGSATPTPGQRALVAALALAGPDGAGIETLADAVWAGRPPSSARASLQNQMTRLRRVHGDELIVCDQGRYRLGVATDVERFSRVVGAVTTPPIDPPSIAALTQALGLWRGVPFTDLDDCHRADIERSRLVQERARAAEILAAGRLARGDLDRCVADLWLEVEDDPFRDRAWELLFVALQRAGRAVEAAAAHGAHLERLRDRLGLFPSESLLEIGRRLERGETLAAPAWAVPAVTTAVADRTDRRRGSRCGHQPMVSRCRTRDRGSADRER